jgi:hypothetical protein
MVAHESVTLSSFAPSSDVGDRPADVRGFVRMARIAPGRCAAKVAISVEAVHSQGVHMANARACPECSWTFHVFGYSGSGALASTLSVTFPVTVSSRAS